MPLEPERDIEKALRDYAKRRWEQAGTPPPMHPATRRLLQGEVARLKKRAPPSPGFWPQFLWGSWPRILANAAVALLLVACVLLLPTRSKNKNASQPQTLLAKNERSSDAEQSVRRDAAKSAPAAAPSVAENRPSPEGLAHGTTPATTTAAGSREMPALEKDKSAAESSVASAKSSPPAANTRFYSGNSSVALDKKQQPVPGSVDTLSAGTPAAATPPQPTSSLAAPSVAAPPAQPSFPPPAALTAGGVMLTDQDKRLGLNGNVTTFSAATVTQQFSLANPLSEPLNDSFKAAKAPVSPRVLSSFRVEQTGNQLRVIDSDGSVYSGSLQTPADVSGQLFAYDEISAARQTLQKTDGTNAPAQSTAGFFFRVTGTNLTLNQPVVFTGNFLADDRAPSSQSNITTVSGTIGGGGFVGAGRAQTALQTRSTNLLSKNELQTVPTIPAFQLSNSRLQGQALIGGTNQIPINALPVKP
jgi:hypothetical protein